MASSKMARNAIVAGRRIAGISVASPSGVIHLRMSPRVD
jgi:hypothetical protein